MFGMKNQNGFTHVLLLIALVILIILSIGAIGYYVYTSQIKDNFKTSNNGACNRTGDIDVCLTVNNASIEYGQSINAKTIIKNVGSVDYNTGFNCTDTTPNFIINGENRIDLNMSVCGQAITEVTVKPNETIAHEESLPGNALQPGEYELQTNWSGNISGKIRIKIKPQNTKDSERLNQACLKGEYSANCRYIEIISVKGLDTLTNCDELYKLYDKYGMGKPNPQTAPEKNELCNIGIVKYIVPNTSAADYVKKLEEDPTVESVSSY